MRPNKVKDTKAKKVELIKGGFYESTRITLIVFRFSGCLPVSGFFHRNSNFIRCTWKSPYTLVFMFTIVVQVLMMGVHIHDCISSTYELRRLTATVFSSFTSISLMILFVLSKNWPKFVKKVESIERSLPLQKNVDPACCEGNALLAVILLGFLVEQAIFFIYTSEMAKDCFMLDNDSGFHLKSYFLVIFGWFFDYVPFDYVTAFLLLIAKFQHSFLGLINDSLVMVCSRYLTNRFKEFNRIFAQKQKGLALNGTGRLPWPELQVHYTQLTRLVKIVDRNINPMVFMSFTFNLIYLGQQIFYILNYQRYQHSLVKVTNCLSDHSADWETILYLTYSGVFTTARTLLVSFLAAQLNTLSREPLTALHTAPSSAYNVDMQRFMDQVYHSKIALTGLEFFHVTRGMILTMLATLMTYELVLLQFRQY